MAGTRCDLTVVQILLSVTQKYVFGPSELETLRLTLLYRHFFTCLSQRDEETQALKDRIQQRLKKGWDFEDEEEVFCHLISSLRPQTFFRFLLENCPPTGSLSQHFALK